MPRGVFATGIELEIEAASTRFRSRTPSSICSWDSSILQANICPFSQPATTYSPRLVKDVTGVLELNQIFIHEKPPKSRQGKLRIEIHRRLVYLNSRFSLPTECFLSGITCDMTAVPRCPIAYSESPRPP
eukprot:gene25245-biopygen10501